MPETYQFKSNYWARIARLVPAETVANELASLHANGDLTPTRVIEIATPDGAPLHPAFEWDDTVAGKEYRLVQARQLIRAIVVISETTPAQSLYVHVPSPEQGEGKYVPLSTVVQKVDEYQRALDAAQQFLDVADHRFQELRRLAEAKGGKVEALAIAAQGFLVVREALQVLRGS